jgi:O-antigen/teichoic acid export membrane protein
VRQGTRFIVNSGLLYGRMVGMLALALLATRWMLGALGEVEFGVLMAIIAATLIVRPVSASLTYAAMRHLAFEMGRGEAGHAAAVFQTFLIISGLVAAALWLGTATLLPLMLELIELEHVPGGTAVLVYHLIFGSYAVALLLAAPYRALLNAHQAFLTLSLWDLLQGTAVAVAAVAMFLVDTERLTRFAVVHFVGFAGLAAAVVLVCLVRFPEGRPTREAPTLGEVLTRLRLAGWHFLGEVTIWARAQLSLVFMNVFFGPVVNGAFALGTRVDDAHDRVGRPVVDSMRPALIQAAGRGDDAHVQDLVVAMNKFAVLCVLALLLPVLLETRQLLLLWLGAYPVYAVIFVQLAAAARSAQFFSLGYVHLMAARDEIGRLMLVTTLPQLAALAVLAALYALTDLPPWLLPAVFCALMLLLALVVQPVTASRQAGVPLAIFYRRVVLPLVVVGGAALAAAAAARVLLPEGLGRVAAVTAVSLLVSATGAWYVVMSATERAYVRQLARKAVLRLRGGAAERSA